MLGWVVPEGAGELNEREGVEGVVVEGLGDEYERELGVVVFGADGLGDEKERLLEDEPDDLDEANDRLLLLAAARAGLATAPNTKTTVITRASTRRTQAQGRMVPLPPNHFPVAEFRC